MTRPGRRAVLRLILLLVLLTAVLLAGRRGLVLVPQFAAWVERLGAWGMAVFAAGYVVGTVAMVPGSALTLAAGALFGVVQGSLLVFLSASAGAAAAFLIARHLARGVVERRLAGDARFAVIDRAIGTRGRRIVLLLRLSPAIPFNLLNYALGLTRVRFRDFLFGSVGMLPGILLYVYYGKVAGDVARAVSGMPARKGTADYLLLGLGLVATIAVTVLLTRTARRALQEVTNGERVAG